MDFKEFKEQINELGYNVWKIGDTIGIYNIKNDDKFRSTHDLVIITQENPGFSFQAAFFQMKKEKQIEIEYIVEIFVRQIISQKRRLIKGGL